MELPSNALDGDLPLEHTKFVTLNYLNLSNYKKFGGQILLNGYNMNALELLDLSRNNFTGPLPHTLPPALSRFNVSLNDLSGANIPSNNQFPTLPESSYLPGNLGLCGVVIRRPCLDDVKSSAEVFGISAYVSLPGSGMGAVMWVRDGGGGDPCLGPSSSVCVWSATAGRPTKYGLFTSRF